jgi:ParB family transcriptional regulator, chromosome partitioning protein
VLLSGSPFRRLRPYNTTTIIEAEHGADEGMQQPTQGTLEHLDPHELTLETNVRDDAALIADFVDSVREHGVINPIVAVRGDDGVVRVRAGQRRTVPGKLVFCAYWRCVEVFA